MGTVELYIFKPTLDHSAKGSKLTPLDIKFFASSLRFVFNEFALIVKTFWESEAYMNLTASFGENKLKIKSQMSELYSKYD